MPAVVLIRTLVLIRLSQSGLQISADRNHGTDGTNDNSDNEEPSNQVVKIGINWVKAQIFCSKVRIDAGPSHIVEIIDNQGWQDGS